MTNHRDADSSPSPDSLIDDLARSFEAVGTLIAQVGPDQWSGPTPCVDWTVRRLVDHLIGMNLVFAALLAGKRPPQRPAAEHVEPNPVSAFRASAAGLVAAFSSPGVLGRDYGGPPGSATGAERLQIRLYDLLAHGWDLAHATGQQLGLPDEVAERSLAFARTQVGEQVRPGRFDPPRAINEHAPAIDRLAAFLGRPAQ
jgi:uncharacterized protein (TIGR03086 family)